MGLPDIRALENYTPPLTTKIFDVNGKTIANLSIQRRTLLTLNKIPVDIQNAVIAVEDDQFFHHWGISPKGIIRSALIDLLHARIVQGASTITQQLAKQVFLTPQRTIARKIREVLLAIQIERNFSKEEILQLYLNQVYFGEGAYGVQSAAKIYFGKDVSQLTLPDCALLAGLVRSPRWNSPFRHPNHARKRRAVVLQRMFEQGMITEKEKEDANNAPIPTSRPVGPGTMAPFFVEHIRQRLEQEYGTNAVWRGGLKVYTTLNLDMQQIAEQAMEKHLAAFDEAAAKRRAQKDAELAKQGIATSTATLGPIQGAYILLDVKTGAVRAMIGGRGNSVFNRATQARRQPGSTFKPFVWAAALNSGMTASTLINDSPVAYYYDGRDWRLLEGATDQYSINLATQPFASSPDFKIWVPNDFDSKFFGIITLRRALEESRNVVSIKLIMQIGAPLVVSLAHRAGIYSHLDSVPSLGLGSSVVSPLEMANAFGTFANGGIHVVPYTIEKVEDRNGRVLEEHVPIEKSAMSPQLAYLITYLLEGVVQNGTGRYARRIGRPIAGKTGTTNDNKDLWFVGFTPNLVAAAWMGYDDFASLGRPSDITGGSTVVPWWTEIMSQILKGTPKEDFTPPDKIVFRPIDKVSGFLALPSCPRGNIFLEAYLQNAEPQTYCPLDHSQPLGPQLKALLENQKKIEAQSAGTNIISSSTAASKANLLLSLPSATPAISSPTNNQNPNSDLENQNDDNSAPFILR
jgi:penicillin-binding protein 1A